MSSVHVRVEGRVQGVGFRYFVQEKAEELGLIGWVRNAPDGSVEAYAQGRVDAVEAWMKALHQGPPLSRVTALHPEWNVPSELDADTLRTFEIR